MKQWHDHTPDKPQLRSISFKIINSSTLLGPAWKDCLNQLNLPDRWMPRDVTTRWNLTYDMLDFAIKYHRAIDAMTNDQNNDLQSFKLDGNEWKMVGQLHDVLEVSQHSMDCWVIWWWTRVLQILKDATLFFSCTTPSFSTVIPAMDEIEKELTTWRREYAHVGALICAAIRIAKRTLNWYYELTDLSEVYWIAMSKFLTPSVYKANK